MPEFALIGKFGVLARVHGYCRARGLPLLDILAISVMTGLPGENYPVRDIQDGNIAAETGRVWCRNWWEEPIPTAADFA